MWDDLLQPASEEVASVSGLTRRIKETLEKGFSGVWVRGEVSNLRRQSSGHLYFTLKDAESQLPCALFARDAASQNLDLRDGMEVLVFGNLSVFPPHGRYQLIAKVVLESGHGRLQLEFERLKQKLAAEGLFHAERKRPLPIWPARIAVVTSPTGAAIRDFARILRRRGYRGRVMIYPARVQGAEAAGEIIDRLRRATAAQCFDAIVLTRGGGSIEDLWPFNEEAVVREVAASTVPVISAIGHEIDTVLTDFAADRRAETPSGAAELLSSLYLETRQRFEDAARELKQLSLEILRDRKQSVRDLRSRMQILAPGHQVRQLAMKLDDVENRLTGSLEKRLVREREKLATLSRRLGEHHPRSALRYAGKSLSETGQRLRRAVRQQNREHRTELEHLRKRLENSSLGATLRRGYAILEKPDGTLLDSAEKVSREDKIRARLHDGKVGLRTDGRNPDTTDENTK